MYYKYLKYILEHKKNVFIECIKLAMKHKGKLRVQLIVHAFTHDLSKFLPCEFIPYAKYFYSEKNCKKCKGYLNCNYNQIGLGSGNFAKECVDYDDYNFNKAWEHHYKHNKHHEDYWQGKTMPYLYVMQLIADWKGMSRKFGDTAQEYYLKNYKKFNMTYQTRLNLEFNLDINDSIAHNYGHTLKEFADMYNKETFDKYFGYIREKYKVDTYKLLTE